MHAGQHDDIGIDCHRLAGERQAVADDVGDAVEDLRRLVVVRQDDGIALPLQIEDGVDIIGEGRPFDGRDDPPHAVIERGRARGGDRHGPNYSPNEYNWHILILSIRNVKRVRAAISSLRRFAPPDRLAKAEALRWAPPGVGHRLACLLDQILLFDQAPKVWLVNEPASQRLDGSLQLQQCEASAGINSKTTGRYLILVRKLAMPVARIRR